MNILDLDPQSFEVYLAESNPPPEQREFLLQEYRKRNSAFAPGYEAIQEAERELAEEGRRRLSVLPASVPQGMSFFDAIQAGEAELALPAFLTGTAESAMTAVDMPGATLRGPVSADEMEQAATDLSEYLMLGAAPAVGRAVVKGVDPNTARMFVGPKTQNPTAKQALDRAVELFDGGDSPEDIWRKTSEEFPDTPASVLPDGTPFYEISDENTMTRNLIDQEVLDPETAEYLRSQLVASPENTDQLLSEILMADELYADVPEVASLKTYLRSTSVPGQYDGIYYRREGPLDPKIKVRAGLQSSPQRQASVLLHEGQHGVQEASGLPGGTNPDAMQKAIDDAMLPELMPRVKLNNLSSDIESIQRGFDAPDELVLPFLQRLDKNALTLADTQTKNRLKVINAAKQPKTGQYGGARGLYLRNPGEALARLTADRRRLTMEQRRAKSPMRQLEGGISDLLAWENLAEVRSGQDVRQLFDFESPAIEGVDANSYAEAVDIFVRNQLRDIVEDTTTELRSVVTPEQRAKVIEAGQNRIDKIFNKALSSYK